MYGHQFLLFVDLLLRFLWASCGGKTRDVVMQAQHMAEVHADGLQSEKRDLRKALHAARQLCTDTQRQVEQCGEDMQIQREHAAGLNCQV